MKIDKEKTLCNKNYKDDKSIGLAAPVKKRETTVDSLLFMRYFIFGGYR